MLEAEKEISELAEYWEEIKSTKYAVWYFRTLFDKIEAEHWYKKFFYAIFTS